VGSDSQKGTPASRIALSGLDQGVWYQEWVSRLRPLLGLILLSVIIIILSPVFLTPTNLLNVARQSSINAILAAGQTFVILTGGIDLSVGSILAVGSTASTDLAVRGVPVPLAILIGFGMGGIMGGLTGLIVSRTKIPPFIVTLGMLNIGRGTNYIWGGARVVSNLPASFSVLGRGYVLGIPAPVLVMVVVYILGFLVLTQTKFGRALYGIGGNIESAKLSGINVRRCLLSVYVISGCLAALGGIVLAGRLNSGQPEAGVGYELDSIAAVVIGGTSLFGGEGGIAGTLIGAFVMGVLRNGLNLLNVSAFYQLIAIGAVVIAAVGVDTLRQRD
jgi:ribose transport system permease protein